MSQRLSLEFQLIDSGTGTARRMIDRVRELGAEGQRAGRYLDEMAQSWEEGFKGLASSREMYQQLAEPGVRAAADLQAALKDVEISLDPDSARSMTERLAELSASAADIAGPTKFSQAEILGVQSELARAGVKEEDLGAASGAVAKLATAEKLSAQEATAAILTLKSLWNLSSSELVGAADLAARAGGATETDPRQIAEALAYAPGAAQLPMAEVMAALGAVSPVMKGSMAGTGLDAFLKTSAAGDKKYKLNLFDAGEMKPMADVAKALEARFGGLTEQDRTNALNKAFGEQGGRFVEALLSAERANKGVAATLVGMDRARSLDSKVEVLSSGYNAQADALGGTITSTLAELFRPALNPLEKAAAGLNGVVGDLGAAAAQDERIGQAVSYTALGLPAAMAAMGVGRMAWGGGQGAMGISQLLRGFAGNARGAAEGMAMEKATGGAVQPVFVTNWPGGGATGMTGAAARAEESLAQAAQGSSANLLKMAEAAGKFTLVATVFAEAVGVGTAINESMIKGTKAEKVIQTSQAVVAAGPIGALLGGTAQKDAANLRDEAFSAIGIGPEVSRAIQKGMDLVVGAGAMGPAAIIAALKELKIQVEVNGMPTRTTDSGATAWRAVSRTGRME